MSDSSEASNRKSGSKNIQELLLSNLPLIQDEIAKLRNEASESVTKTIDISPAQVNIVKVSEEKIVIEVNLKQSHEPNDNNLKDSNSDDSSKSSHDKNHDDEVKSVDRTTNNRSTLNDATADDNATSSNDSPSTRRICRSLSESDGDLTPKPKGILKYPKEWKKRTLSECSLEGLHSLTDYDTDKDASTGDLSESECGTSKSAKKVTFNQKVFKSVFKKNSTIGTKKSRKERASSDNNINKNNNNNNISNSNNKKKKKPSDCSSVLISNAESQENDCNVNNSEPIATMNIPPKEEEVKTFELKEDVLESDQSNSCESVNPDDWAEVRSKKSRNRRKRTDSRSSDHSECEDIPDKPMTLLQDMHLHATQQIEVK